MHAPLSATTAACSPGPHRLMYHVTQQGMRSLESQGARREREARQAVSSIIKGGGSAVVGPTVVGRAVRWRERGMPGCGNGSFQALSAGLSCAQNHHQNLFRQLQEMRASWAQKGCMLSVGVCVCVYDRRRRVCVAPLGAGGKGCGSGCSPAGEALTGRAAGRGERGGLRAHRSGQGIANGLAEVARNLLHLLVLLFRWVGRREGEEGQVGCAVFTPGGRQATAASSKASCCCRRCRQLL